jgi:hypothetical protein
VKQFYSILLVGITALVLSWAIPALVRNAVHAASRDMDAGSHFTRADIAEHRWQAVSRYAFPMYLTLSGYDAGRLQPAFKVNFGWALFISHLMFFAYLFVVRRKGVKPPPLLRLVQATAIILLGVPGLLAVCLCQIRK